MRCSAALILIAFLFPGCREKSRVPAGLFRQVEWLKGQAVPNAVVPEPYPTRRHLLLSYEVPADIPEYKYLHAKSFVYDNAVAAIALCHAGEWEDAQRLLTSMAGLVRADGSLWFSVNTAIDWPSEGDRESALVRTGAVAWAGYAFCFYLENCPQEKLQNNTKMQFLEAATRIAGFIMARWVDQPGNPLNGLVTGGEGAINLALVKPGGVAEKWDSTQVRWASAEHNLDAWFFLSHLSVLAGNREYRRASDAIKEALVLGLWSKQYGQFFRGLKENGEKDTVLALDCASWAAAFLMAVGKKEMAEQCLESARERYAVEYKGLRGYLPYRGVLVYEQAEINRHFFPDQPDLKWGDFPFVWLEGNYGVLLAEIACGGKKQARERLEQWTAYFDNDPRGGIPYTLGSRPVPYQFSEYKCVASTGWHVIIASMLYGVEMKRPFFSGAEK